MVSECMLDERLKIFSKDEFEVREIGGSHMRVTLVVNVLVSDSLILILNIVAFTSTTRELFIRHLRGILRESEINSTRW